MFELDVDKLNDVMEGRNDARGCGKTTAMLVQVLTHAELFQPERMWVEAHTQRMASYLRFMCVEIACRMGWRHDEIYQAKSGTYLRIGKTTIHFVKPIRELDRIGMQKEPIYRDHFWPVETSSTHLPQGEFHRQYMREMEESTTEDYYKTHVLCDFVEPVTKQNVYEKTKQMIEEGKITLPPGPHNPPRPNRRTDFA